LKDVNKVQESDVVSNFNEKSFDLAIKNLNNVNYTLAITNLCFKIVPEESLVKVCFIFFSFKILRQLMN